MRTWLPLALLGFVALGALAVALRRSAAPEPPARPRAQASPQILEAPPSTPPLPTGYKLPDMEVLTREASARQVPVPPKVDILADDQVDDYRDSLRPFLQSADTASLARDLMWRFYTDVREARTQAKKKEVEARRTERVREREDHLKAHRELHPRTEQDPNRPVGPPLIPPPVLPPLPEVKTQPK